MKLQNRTSFNWEDLRLFLEIARHARLAEAAARLCIDPTTLGRRLRHFEADLGVDLFERTPQGLRLTRTGQELAARAEEMEIASLKALETVGGDTPSANSIVRISTAEGFGSYILAPALAKLAARSPHLRIDLVAASGFLSVSKREADIAVLLARPTTGRLFVRRLSNYRLMLYASRDYLAAQPRIFRIEDVHSHRLIGYVDDLIYSPQLRYLDELPFEAVPAIRSSSIIAQYQATRAGTGLCILPCFMADNDTSLVRVLPERVQIERSFWLALHEEIRDFPRIKAAVEFLSETVTQKQNLLTGMALA